jgi:hypothetical protein
MIKKYRDVTLLELDDKNILTVACDSCGGIGNKEHDVIKADPYITGYYTACVCLAETLAIGAKPITIINNFCVEMNDTGKKILKGVYKALEMIGLDKEDVVTGSTEENIPVSVTGIGLTVIGKVDTSIWEFPKPKAGNIAVTVGNPKVGNEVLEAKNEIITIDIIKKIKSLDYIEDILPVGSKGIEYEAVQMALSNNLEFRKSKNIKVDMKKSAGPATCAVLAMDKDYLEQLKKIIDIPINVIGDYINVCI